MARSQAGAQKEVIGYKQVTSHWNLLVRFTECERVISQSIIGVPWQVRFIWISVMGECCFQNLINLVGFFYQIHRIIISRSIWISVKSGVEEQYAQTSIYRSKATVPRAIITEIAFLGLFNFLGKFSWEAKTLEEMQLKKSFSLSNSWLKFNDLLQPGQCLIKKRV